MKQIPLTQDKFAIVDDEDFEELNRYKWHAHKNRENFYAVRFCKGKRVSMHRVILNAPDDLQCDHMNHNGLDNRKCNLRLCTVAQNNHNRRPRKNATSKYKGVSFDTYKKKWEAAIRIKSLRIHIGRFNYEQDAAIAYDFKAAELFGEFAFLNYEWFPELRMWLKQSMLFEPDAPKLFPAAACG